MGEGCPQQQMVLCTPPRPSACEDAHPTVCMRWGGSFADKSVCHEKCIPMTVEMAEEAVGGAGGATAKGTCSRVHATATSLNSHRPPSQ